MTIKNMIFAILIAILVPTLTFAYQCDVGKQDIVDLADAICIQQVLAGFSETKEINPNVIIRVTSDFSGLNPFGEAILAGSEIKFDFRITSNIPIDIFQIPFWVSATGRMPIKSIALLYEDGETVPNSLGYSAVTYVEQTGGLEMISCNIRNVTDITLTAVVQTNTCGEKPTDLAKAGSDFCVQLSEEDWIITKAGEENIEKVSPVVEFSNPRCVNYILTRAVPSFFLAANQQTSLKQDNNLIKIIPVIVGESSVIITKIEFEIETNWRFRRIVKIDDNIKSGILNEYEPNCEIFNNSEFLILITQLGTILDDDNFVIIKDIRIHWKDGNDGWNFIFNSNDLTNMLNAQK